MIWFMTPDLPSASGGVQTIYSIVSALNATGHAAVVWHGTEGHRYSTFSSDAPVVWGLEQRLAPGDVLVMQETGGPKWASLAPEVPTVMLVQGHRFVFAGLDVDSEPSAGFPGWPQVVATVATSDVIERVLHLMCGPLVPVHRVPVAIDAELFQPLPKRRQIAYMPRRRRDDLVAAAQLLRRGGLLPSGWTFVAIDGMTQPEVARTLGESAIFISGALREGFGMPGAEALAAGCAVVGFTGEGGAEFLTDETALVVHDDDIVSLAEAVGQTAHAFDAGAEALTRRIARGRALVLERYSIDAQRAAALTVGAALTTPDAPSAIRTPVVVEHYQSRAPRGGAFWLAYYGARAAAGRLARRITRR